MKYVLISVLNIFSLFSKYTKIKLSLEHPVHSQKAGMSLELYWNSILTVNL